MKTNLVSLLRRLARVASLALVAFPFACLAQNKPATVQLGETNFYLIDLGPLIRKPLSTYKPNQSWAAPPRGLQTLGGVPFYLEGKLELTGMGPARDGRFEPVRIKAIPVGQKGQRLHVLHGTAYDDSEGNPIYKLVLHYADGQQRYHYLAYGVHLRNWYLEPKETFSDLEDSNSVVAWAGSSPDTDRAGAKLRLFRTTLPNSRPDREIKSIELVSLFGRATPSIVALTLESNPAARETVSDNAEPPDDSSFRAELVVRVTDPQSGMGVPGVRVKLEVSDERRKFAFGEYDGDEQGRVVLEYPPRRIVSMHLQVSAPGRPLKLISVSRGDHGEFPRELTVKLGPGTRIGGVVKSDSGDAIEGARVRINGVVRDEAGQILPKELEVVRTDAKGAWSSMAVAQDFADLNFQLSHPEFLPAEFDQESEPNPAKGVNAATLLAGKALMTMKPGYRIDGTVKDSEGRPIPGAEVILRLNADAPTNQTAKADAAGRFKVVVLEMGDAQAVALARGFAPQLTTLGVNEESKPLEFTLGPGFKLKGRVIDAATNPLAGVTVRLEPWQGSTLVNWQTETDADGRFSWDSAPTSAAMYSLGKSGYVTQRRDDFSVEDETTITLMKAFLLTGKVVDAETGEPVTQFQVIKGRRYGPDDMPHWERHNTVRGRDGEYSLKHDEPSGPKVQVLVEAEGYLPEVSPPFLSTGWHTNDFKLKKGEGPRGMVKGPSGKPVEGAQVALLSGGYVNLGSAQFRDPRGGDTHIAITDTDGRFSLPAAYATEIVAVHSSGYAEVSPAELSRSHELVLQPWGRVEGKLVHGTRAGTNEEVMLAPKRTGSMSINYDWSNFKTVTDEQGGFAFTNVPPGRRQLVRLVKTEANSWLWTHVTPIDVKPGDATRITYGGQGRPVIGKVVSSDPERTIQWRSGHHTLHTPMPKPPKGFKTPEEWDAWNNSPELKAARERYRYYAVPFAPDGSFRVEDIPAGKYELALNFYEPETERGRLGRQVGSIMKEIEVPEIPGGVSDEPFDIGALELSLKKDLKPGMSAPDFEVKTLDDKPLRLADFRGRFVLLDFWATWCGPCVAELPYLKAVFDEFGQDERFAFISLSLDADVKEPREFVRKQKLNWIHGFLGEWSQTTLPNQYGVNGIPSLFLIDQEGKIIAKDLRGSAIKPAVAKALNARAGK